MFGRGADKYGQIEPQFFNYFGQKLVDYAGLQAGSTVLDIACGRDASLFPTCERVGSHGRVVGIDLSADMAAATQLEIESRQLEWTRGNMSEEGLPESTQPWITRGQASKGSG